MRKWLIVTVAVGALSLAACAPGSETDSSGGSPSQDQPERPLPPSPKPGDPSKPVGACLEKTYDGKGQICSEHYSGSLELTPADVAHACAVANVSFVERCPPNPKVSCRIKEPTYEILMKVYVPDSQKESWVKACQDRGGELTLDGPFLSLEQ